jgi:hypothetical protein
VVYLMGAYLSDCKKTTTTRNRPECAERCTAQGRVGSTKLPDYHWSCSNNKCFGFVQPSLTLCVGICLYVCCATSFFSFCLTQVLNYACVF